jgi:alpha-N-arabinofuranosidase
VATTFRLTFCTLLITALAARAGAQSTTLTVDAAHPTHAISPMLYGLMTEEINHSYDGGLYAELIRNRIFRDTPPPPQSRRRPGVPVPPTTEPGIPPEKPLHWSLITDGGADGAMAADATDPVNTVALTHSLRLDVKSIGDNAGARVGVANDGFWGIPVKPSTTYRASFYARASDGFAGPIQLSIEDKDGAPVASATVSGVSREWKRYEATLTTGGNIEASIASRFVLSTKSPGTIWFSLVSLFPPTYHDRPNGNRIDLMELLAGMHPAFLRFPGGNYVEGDYFNERFNWKETVGPIEQRPGHQGPWGYRSSDGLGLLEFLEWCEDLKMQPVLAVFAGYTLRGQHIAAGPELEPYVQEALDEIEYVTGDESTTWGKRRATDGHPAPFDLTYVEIGNEDNFDRIDGGTYDGRFIQFYDAIKEKYPKLQIIATARVHTRTPDVMDDHYYRPAVVMSRDTHHYDKPDYRSGGGPKIFVGEWASREAPPNRTLTPSLWSALGDGAWMTGLERNSDVVLISCYAPLLTNVNGGASQWQTDLIGYDVLRSFGSPSYHVQAMFGQNRGDQVLPVTLTNATETTPFVPLRPSAAASTAPTTTGNGSLKPVETLFATASRDDASGDVIIKFVNMRQSAQQVQIDVQGVATVTGATASIVTGQPGDTNSINEPTKAAMQPLTLATQTSSSFTQEFPPYAAAVIRLHTR